MKSTNTQVRRQGGRKTVNPQAPTKTKSAARTHGTAKLEQPVTLVFTDPDGHECARVAMQGQLFTRFKLAARQLGVSLSEFVEQTVREDMKRGRALVRGGAR